MSYLRRDTRPPLDEAAFLPGPLEDQWLHMTAFLLANLDTRPDLLADAIYAEVMMDRGNPQADYAHQSAAPNGTDWTIRLHGITATGASLEEAAIDWRTRAHGYVAAAANQRRKVRT